MPAFTAYYPQLADRRFVVGKPQLERNVRRGDGRTWYGIRWDSARVAEGVYSDLDMHVTLFYAPAASPDAMLDDVAQRLQRHINCIDERRGPLPLDWAMQGIWNADDSTDRL